MKTICYLIAIVSIASSVAMLQVGFILCIGSMTAWHYWGLVAMLTSTIGIFSGIDLLRFARRLR